MCVALRVLSPSLHITFPRANCKKPFNEIQQNTVRMATHQTSVYSNAFFGSITGSSRSFQPLGTSEIDKVELSRGCQELGSGVTLCKEPWKIRWAFTCEQPYLIWRRLHTLLDTNGEDGVRSWGLRIHICCTSGSSQSTLLKPVQDLQIEKGGSLCKPKIRGKSRICGLHRRRQRQNSDIELKITRSWRGYY